MAMKIFRASVDTELQPGSNPACSVSLVTYYASAVL
jgi:hypothetical protein